MRYKYIFLVIFLMVSTLSFSYINIYPVSFNQRIDGVGGIKDFTLTNVTNKKIKYKIDILNTDKETSMSQWTEIYPKIISLNPGQKGEVKMYVRAPKKIKNGEYSTILNIKELEVADEKRTKKKISVFTDLRIKLYGYVGEIGDSISLREAKNKSKNI